MTDRGTSVSSARERLLAATAALLRRHGPGGASARAICALAEVKAPTLYHHFGDLDGLRRAVVEQAFAAAAARKADPPAGDPLTELRWGWDVYVGFAAEEPALFAVLNREITSGRLPASASASHARLVETVTRLAAGRRLALEPEEVARQLWAAAHGVACLVCAGVVPWSRTAGAERALREMILDAALHERSGR